MRRRILCLLLALTAALCGCGAAEPSPAPAECRLVVEQSEAFTAPEYSVVVAKGAAARLRLTPAEGWVLTGTDRPDATLTPEPDGTALLTVPRLRYSAVVTVQAEPAPYRIRYEAAGGAAEDGATARTLAYNAKQLRPNTATELFRRAGYTQTGWSTAPDGTAPVIGLGSRVEVCGGTATLYAQWAAWTDVACFAYEIANGGVTVTGCTAQGQRLVIPAEIEGLPVTALAAGAFCRLPCTEVIFPESLRTVAQGAFVDCPVARLTLFDSIQTLYDGAFVGTKLQTLRINAARPPVYSGGYFATFADKYDRLLALAPKRKLVLFSGSSTRFGYDSAAIDAAFPEYEVVNMGVFAYTAALPQLLLIEPHLLPGDVLLHSPEFDAAQRQFCTQNTLDAPFFCMMEANYDMLASLDLTRFDNVLSALHEYLAGKASLPCKAYSLSPVDFDEDGNPTALPSYNAYGDYILYRPNAESDTPVYGLPVPYTVEAYPYGQFLAPYNAVCREFLAKGIAVYVTYAPRNRQALSAESTPEARAALDAYLRANLIVPVISPLEEALWPGRYLYGTDNHLSTEGVALRTARIIEELKAALGGAQ